MKEANMNMNMNRNMRIGMTYLILMLVHVQFASVLGFTLLQPFQFHSQWQCQCQSYSSSRQRHCQDPSQSRLFVQNIDAPTTTASATATTTATTVIPVLHQLRQKQQQDDGHHSHSHKASRSSQNSIPSNDINFLMKRTQYLLHITSNSNSKTQTNNNHDDDDATGTGPTTSSTSTKKLVKLQLHRRTFHWLIDAWANTKKPYATQYAQALLDAMISYSTTSSSTTTTNNEASQLQLDIKPDVKTYTKVINVYTKANQRDQKRNKRNNNSDENKSDENNNIDSNGKADVGEIAKTLFHQMIHEQHIQPTTQSYNAVIQALAKSDKIKGAQKAEEFLNYMEQLYQHQNQTVSICKPNTINYNTIITAYANSGDIDAHTKCENILKHKIEYPNTISYNACIDAYTKSGTSKAGEKAEQLLQEMHTLYNQNTTNHQNVQPNTRSYNSVMNAYAKTNTHLTNSKSAIQANRILEQMEHLYYEQQNHQVKPDFFSFAIVINAWAKTNEYGCHKAQKALELFQHMMELYNQGNEDLRPNVVIYNAIINACAYTIGDEAEQRQAMEIAHTMIKELESSTYAKPDQVTYGTFLKVCENQMPPCQTRTHLLNVIFRKCAKDGMVGRFVLAQLYSIMNDDELEELLGSYYHDKNTRYSTTTIVGWKHLPLKWRCNVVEGKKKQRHYLVK
mmetsp:Transcript_28934/g.33643  ORF Transcript_28934/g.33643 Transcript_28934/m.33643 type:complete len:679 (+) Transcript_28934:464-2500(+)